MTTIKEHWENVYATKADQEVSWYQENPETSLSLIASLDLGKNQSIIDVGGGNSNLAAQLTRMEYTDVSVLDISAKALERTRRKLKEKAGQIKWITSNILNFIPASPYDLWHDRATFHFLTREEDVEKYIDIVRTGIKQNGYLILATFSKNGPEKCSGLPITQYSEEKLIQLFSKDFELIRSLEETHQTPFDTTQSFIYTVFKRK